MCWAKMFFLGLVLWSCHVGRFTFRSGPLLPGKEADVILLRCWFHVKVKKERRKNTLGDSKQQHLPKRSAQNKQDVLKLMVP